MRKIFAMIANATQADVAELADALDLGSSTARCEGSSPFVRISSKNLAVIVHLLDSLLKLARYYEVWRSVLGPLG